MPEKKLKNIAVLMQLRLAFGREAARGISRYAHQRRGWRLFTLMENTDEIPPNWRMDGALVQMPRSDRWIGRHTPRVYVGTNDPRRKAPRVNVDDAQVGRMGAAHLSERGYGRMAYYGLAQSGFAVDRRRGFEAALAEFNIEQIHCPHAYQSKATVDWTGLVDDLADWLCAAPKPLGVMTSNDGAARVAGLACQIAGVRVPDEVGILGVDNDVVRCELSPTPLSSVELPAEQLGFEAAAMLDDLLEGRPTPSMPKLLPPIGVVVRESTDVTAIDDREVAAAIMYIRDHFTESIGIDQVAVAALASRSALTKRFKRKVGRSMQAEITRLRLERARELLARGDLPIDRVAVASGFNHKGRFHAVFRKTCGVTPAKYRQRFRVDRGAS